MLCNLDVSYTTIAINGSGNMNMKGLVSIDRMLWYDKGSIAWQNYNTDLLGTRLRRG